MRVWGRRVGLLLVLVLCGCVRAGYEEQAAVQRDSTADGAGVRDTAGPGDGTGPVDSAGPGEGQPDLRVCRSQQLSILGDADDGEIDYDAVWLPHGENLPKSSDPAGIYLGCWSDVVQGKPVEGPTTGYFRFRLTRTLPDQASVTAAGLSLWGLAAPTSSAAWDPASHALRVQIQDSPDAPAVSSVQLPAMLATSVRWPASGGLAWNSDADNQRDVAPLVQALIQTQGGLPAGAHLQLWVTGDFSGGSAEVATVDSSVTPARAARLDISWCE